MTTHWISWNDASNALARVGNPTLAMLVPSDGSSIDSERLASAQRTEGRVTGASFRMSALGEAEVTLRGPCARPATVRATARLRSRT